jgi:hypothetical protein
MRAINHALTGAVIGLTISEPVMAVPAALASHYICDIIPHYGPRKRGVAMLCSAKFRWLLIADAILCVGLVLWLVISRPFNWPLAVICAFLAAAPDLLAINRYRRALTHKPWKASWYSKFAVGIQWYERPPGAVVEIAWFIAVMIVLLPFLK